MMTDDLLKAVKASLNITGTHLDETIKLYISEVLEYLSDAGVKDEVLQSEAIIGTVAKGVSDLYFGGGKLSEYFMQRVVQLSYQKQEV